MLKRFQMKYFAIILVALAMTACGTLGGAVSGAGDDLKTVGDWIKKDSK
jgi:predicted small secreted protein